MSGSSGGPSSAGAGAGAESSAGAASDGCFGREVCPGGQVRDVIDCQCRDCRGPDDCGEGVTCNPVTSRCEQDVPCSSHADCGRVSACSPAGACEENAPGGPCARENNCPQSEHCTLGFCGCHVIRYRVTTVPPDVMIVLDRSSSMNEPVGDSTKWDIARKVIADLVAAQATNIRFGLLLYPGAALECGNTDACDAGAVFVGPGEGTTNDLTQALTTATTCSKGTPTAEALGALERSSYLRSTERASFVILLTDGKSTCEPPAPAAKALATRTPSTPTYVVGFGDAVDADELSALAVSGATAGSTPAPGYYQATDAASLGATLSAIAGQTLPCSFDLADSPKPSDSEVGLYFAQEPVPRDPTHQDGWDYDINTNRVDVFGDSCARLSSRSVVEASLVYTCSFTPH